jgi:hypothetical protein
MRKTHEPRLAFLSVFVARLVLLHPGVASAGTVTHSVYSSAMETPRRPRSAARAKAPSPYDGLVASVIAYSRAARAPAKQTVAFAWA